MQQKQSENFNKNFIEWGDQNHGDLLIMFNLYLPEIPIDLYHGGNKYSIFILEYLTCNFLLVDR